MRPGALRVRAARPRHGPRAGRARRRFRRLQGHGRRRRGLPRAGDRPAPDARLHLARRARGRDSRAGSPQAPAAGRERHALLLGGHARALVLPLQAARPSDHLQQAQALAALYEDRKREGWTKERLAPMLEGLRELLPWLKQWHNDPSEEFGGLKLHRIGETPIHV
ncbi:MAG: DUF7008 domain-containing protein [Deltaproteobacteria bacterium]